MDTKILVIEDDEHSMFILSKIMGEQGFQVIQARDGNDGLEAAKQAEPDLILLDIVLPGMDGYTVAKTLRSMPSSAQVPIVAVSSLPLMGNEQHALAAGCNAYVEKPIDLDLLVQQVRNLLPTGDD